MTEGIGWLATGVFALSYRFARPATLRRVQALAACLWIAYGVAMGAAWRRWRSGQRGAIAQVTNDNGVSMSLSRCAELTVAIASGLYASQRRIRYCGVLRAHSLTD